MKQTPHSSQQLSKVTESALLKVTHLGLKGEVDQLVG